MNGWAGAQNLRNNYAGKILPTIQRVERRKTDQIVVTDQYTAQEMAALMRDRRFYLSPRNDDPSRRLADLAEGFAGGSSTAVPVSFPSMRTHRIFPRRASPTSRVCVGASTVSKQTSPATSCTNSAAADRRTERLY